MKYTDEIDYPRQPLTLVGIVPQNKIKAIVAVRRHLIYDLRTAKECVDNGSIPAMSGWTLAGLNTAVFELAGIGVLVEVDGERLHVRQNNRLEAFDDMLKALEGLIAVDLFDTANHREIYDAVEAARAAIAKARGES